MVDCIKTGVLIVGSGPVGVSLQLLLSRMRVPSMLIDKNTLPRNHPRAHYLSNRSMEIWRQLGHLDKVLECVVEPLEYWRYFKYCRHIIDPHLNLYAVQDHFRERYKYAETYHEDLSPSRIANFPQHKLLFLFKALALDRSHLYKTKRGRLLKWLDNEQKLVMPRSKIDDEKGEKLLKLDRPFALPPVSEEPPEELKTQIPFVDGGLKFESFLSKDRAIVSQVKDLRTGDRFNVESMFVVGADGIHSAVARELFGQRNLNENVKDTANLKEVISVHFESSQLGEWVASNPAMMYFIFSQCICVVVCQGGTPPEFVAQIPFFPELEPLSFFDEENCTRLINEAVGTTLGDLKIHKIKKWTVTTNVSPSFVDPETCRVFLAGDAAHLVAPAGGLGMNMGISDAYNLAWRLGRFFYLKSQKMGIYDHEELLSALFARGLDEEDAKLLGEYSLERKATAEYTRDVCLKEVENGSKFAKHLWYNHGNLQNALTMLAPIIPDGSGFIPFVFNSVKNFMKYAYSTPKSMDAIASFSKMLFSKMDGSLGLAFPGSDLAYSYNGGDLKTSKSHRTYSPQSLVGSRVPHCFFYAYRDSTVYKISTVDLPSLMQPAVFYCALVFDRKTVESVLAEMKFSLYYICLWETGIEVGSGETVTINDQPLSRPNSFINTLGVYKGGVEVDEKVDDHFVFNTLEDSGNFDHYNAALKYVSRLPTVPVKRVFSSRSTLDNFSEALFGKVEPLEGTWVLLRPDSHIHSMNRV